MTMYRQEQNHVNRQIPAFIGINSGHKLPCRFVAIKDSFTLTLKFLYEARWCSGGKITCDSKRNIDKDPYNAYLVAQPSDTRRVFAYRTHMLSCATGFSSFHPAFSIFHKYAVLLRKKEPLVLSTLDMHMNQQ